MTVIRLGARCDLESETQRHASFRISEFAVLDDGTEITLDAERGLSTFPSAPRPAGALGLLTAESLEASVRTVVLPDDAEETGDEHPWAWLVELLAARGIGTSAEHLESLPYDVRFSEDVIARLRGGDRCHEPPR